MKLQPIINHLSRNLPFVSDKFSDTLEILSITQLSGVVTVVTDSDHNLSTDDFIVVTGAKSGVFIDVSATNASISGNTVTFTTVLKHNFTENFNFRTLLRKDAFAEIDGAGVFYDGDNIYNSVPNKNQFIVIYNSAPPSLTGSPVAYDGVDRGYNGTKQITVVDPTTFTYTITGTPPDPFGDIQIHKNIRITGTLTSLRIEDMYTKQNKDDFWLYVTEASDTMSKDRNILSDAVTERYGGVSFRSRIIDNFSCFIASPSVDNISGRIIHDELEDVKIALIKTLAGFDVPAQFTFSENFKLNYIGSELFIYDTAKIIKEFTFQGQYDITIEDTFIVRDYISAKTMGYDFGNGMTAQINLNEDET